MKLWRHSDVNIATKHLLGSLKESAKHFGNKIGYIKNKIYFECS